MFAGQLLTLVGDFAGFLIALYHMECITCGRGAVQSQNQCRFGRSCFFNALVTFVEHSLYTSVTCSGQYNIPYFQGSVRYQYGSYISTSLIQRRFDDGTRSIAVGIGLEVEHFGFQQYLFQQIFYSHTFLGRDILRLIFATPFFNEIVHSSQFFFYLIRIGSRLVYLINCKYNRYPCRHCMIDGFLRLRHHVIIGSHNNDGDIRNLCTTGTHSGKRFMTRSIEECDTASVFQLHIVCTDVLCDTSGFSLADIVEQGCLTVVNVSHYRNNRSAGLQVFRSIFFFYNGLCYFRTYIFCFETELFGYQIDCFCI